MENKKKHPKGWYAWWILLMVWIVFLIFCLLASFGLITWRSRITAQQYFAGVCGVVSSVMNLCALRKECDE